MDFNVVTKPGNPDKGTGDEVVTILSTHRKSEADHTPLHLISAEMVAHYQQLDVAVQQLLKSLPKAP